MASQTKVTITHSGASVDYINRFSTINVKRRDCNYDVATLTIPDPTQEFYASNVSLFDEIKIYLKITPSASYTQVFGGYVRQANPVVTSTGKLLILNCKGYGAVLEETHCNRDFGLESSNPTLNTINEIIVDLTDNFVEKSFNGAATGYTISTAKISDYCSTNIKYINNPYRTNLEVIDTLCNLSSAIGAGGTAGGHWIVDNSKNLLFGKIGDHAAGANSPETEWPDWWNTDQAGSTLIEGKDFKDFNLLYKAEEYANHVVLVTDFRRPTYDYWTENNAALWGSSGLASLTAIDTDKVVGTHCIKILGDNVNDGEAWYPSAKDAAWDTSAWGSAKTIPHLNFYMKKDANVSEADTYISLFTSADMLTDSFTARFSTWTEPDNEWVHKSLPIGPYWASSEESKQFRWTPNGAEDWTEINGIAFLCNAGGVFNGTLYIDDLHFDGKIIRSAKDTSEITDHNEIQKVLIARNSMDDSCVAADDSGFAARVVYAELLRRTNLPVTVIFSLSCKPAMMAGQKTHLHICKKPDGSFTYNADFRILTVEHTVDESGFLTTVTATNDLTNSSPISVPDQFAMWQENMFVNSNEAKNIRAGAEVDLLIPMLAKSY